jgi:predicted dithiol-disulfide oxidoreductase (DUF899 family)
MDAEIQTLEMEIMQKISRLNELRRENRGPEVDNYAFRTQAGEVRLLDLFGEHRSLLVIHNMGQACRYCTLWADGFNGLLPHLESALAVVLVSRDAPDTQRAFANSRGWRFRLASHGGGRYAQEQQLLDGESNMPGAIVYEREGESIYRKNSCIFGPGDIYCALWPLLGLAGLGEAEWHPQFRYWQPAEALIDGGERFNE